MLSWKLTATSFLLPVCWACSYVEIPFSQESGDKPSYLIARTMELSNLYGKTEYTIEAIPRGGGNKFGYVAPTNHFQLPGTQGLSIAFEGMNEEGLTISAHYLAQAVYEVPGAMPSVSALDLVPAILANCSSVDDAIKLLESVRVVTPDLGKQNFGGLHWAIADTSGHSMIVEYLEGKRTILENHPRVMTNDPDIRWHWRNLNTYVNLSPNYPWQNDILQIETDDDIGAVPRPIGHGWNLFGLPGDSSPPSRFVRLFYLRGYAMKSQQVPSHALVERCNKLQLHDVLYASGPVKSFKDAVVLGNGLLNNVFLPIGPVAGNPREAGDGPELTDYAVLKSCQTKVMLIRGYVNSQWRQIDLKRLDFSKAHTWPLEDGSLGVQDITHAPTSGRAMYL